MGAFMESVGFFLDLALHTVIAWIDAAVYTIDAEIYNLLIDIASQEVLTQSTIATMANRVYQLLALIMMFRLIFVFVTYVINPDDMVDKTKGYQNIIKKMIISLGLIIIVPWGFREARNLQTVILQDHVIEYFVFGQISDSNVTPGYDFMYRVGRLFIVPYKCLGDCGTSDYGNAIRNEKEQICDANWENNLAASSPLGTNPDCKKNSTCAGKCGLGISTNDEYARALYKAANSSDGKYGIAELMLLPKYGDVSTKTYFARYNTPLLVTTLVGVLIGYMLIVMCIDVAVRSVKLAFYELIAPIPIVSYIGPKNGKDTMLGKWFTQVLKTYGDLFIRIAGLELAIFFISTLIGDGASIETDNIFVTIFLIIGALTFAKSLPNILKDLGVNLDTGGFSLKKKLNDNMLGSKQLKRVGAAGLGLAGGAAANAYKNFCNLYKNRIAERKIREGYETDPTLSASENKKKMKELVKQYRNENKDKYRYSSLTAGAFSAATRAATTKDGKVFAGARQGIKGSTDARDLRDKRQDAGYGAGERFLDSIRSVAGVDTEAKSRLNTINAEISSLQAKAYSQQNIASTRLEQLNGFSISQSQVDQWMKIKDPTSDPTIQALSADARNAFLSYRSAMQQYVELQDSIKKKEKSRSLYEREKK